MGCLRIVFGIFNFLVFLGGAALLGLGIWLHVHPETLYGFVDSTSELSNDTQATAEFNNVLYVLDGAKYFAIAIGAFMVLMGCLGCFGAISKNKCILYLFAAIMVILFLAEVAVTILAFVKYPIFGNFMQDQFNKYSIPAGNPDQKFTNNFVNTVQTGLTCCGWESVPTNQTDVIQSCCDNFNNENDVTVCTLNTMYSEPCEADLKTVGYVIGGIAAGCAVLEILAMLCAIKIARNSSKYA